MFVWEGLFTFKLHGHYSQRVSSFLKPIFTYHILVREVFEVDTIDEGLNLHKEILSLFG